MKKILWLIAFAAACTPAKKENQETAPASAQVQEIALPSISESQKAEGWKLLFDGKSMNGWQFFKGRKNNTWEVKDGMLHCKPLNEKVQGDGDERSDLMTIEEFENFELNFDWNIAAEGNSGVIYRVTEEFDQPYFSGPEYQLIDDKGFPNETPDHLTGTVYGLYTTTSKALKPVGEWNNSKLVVNKNHVEHWLNGQKIVEYELGSADWKKRKAESKWKDATGYGLSPKGHIDLQDHGSEIWFKNVMIKLL